MIESYKESLEEFKRVDHLFYVTLKYTRTVDVIRSVIQRMINTFEKSIDSVLMCLKEEKEIEDIPATPIGKCRLLQEKCTDEKMVRYLDTYQLLRKLIRADYTKREEFRRHVTMITNIDGKDMNIDIDLLFDFYNQTKDFLGYTRQRVDRYKE